MTFALVKTRLLTEGLPMQLTDDMWLALDNVYEGPLDRNDDAVAEPDAWRAFAELHNAGLVTINPDTVEITDAGRAALDEDEEEEEPPPLERDKYSAEYTDVLDFFYDEPVRTDEFEDDLDWCAEQIANGHLAGPDEDGFVSITDAGRALLDEE